MSTIQSQSVIVHIESGLNLSASAQRTSVESAFTTAAITVTTTPEALALGDVVSVRQVALRLVSGDDLLVSVDGGGTYPLSLSDVGDGFMLNLESREVSNITCAADSGGSLNGLYFDLADVDGPVRVWFKMAEVAATGSITYGTPAVAVKATGVLTLTANAADTETVVVGETTYTFKTTLSAGPTVANEVLIGAAATDSIDNLIAAITAAGGEGTNYSTGTVVNASATATAGTGDTMDLEALTAGYTSIETTETLANGSFSAATLTGGLNATSVVVNGTTFTYVASAPGANQFSNIAELEALVEAVSLITSTENGTVVSIVADTAGTAGNAITLALGANTTGTLSVSGATLSGGSGTAPAEPVGGRLIEVAIDEDDAAGVVATKIAAVLDADSQFHCTVATATLTIIDARPGPRTGITAGTSAFTGAISDLSTEVPSVYFKSLGSSEVVVAVAPN